MNRGPGGGTKRRIRTRMQRLDPTTCLVLRNRSVKLIPANWRELLVESVFTTCDRPPKHFFAPLTSPTVPRPAAHIALGSLPTGMVEFTLDRQPYIANYQRRVIDWSLSLNDVTYWPVPKPVYRKGKGGEWFVNTMLPLSDRHEFNPFRLEGIPGINWRHLEQYTAKHKRGEYLGIKTTCGEPCACQLTLTRLWQLGWEMHF